MEERNYYRGRGKTPFDGAETTTTRLLPDIVGVHNVNKSFKHKGEWLFALMTKASTQRKEAGEYLQFWMLKATIKHKIKGAAKKSGSPSPSGRQ